MRCLGEGRPGLDAGPWAPPAWAASHLLGSPLRRVGAQPDSGTHPPSPGVTVVPGAGTGRAGHPRVRPCLPLPSPCPACAGRAARGPAAAPDKPAPLPALPPAARPFLFPWAPAAGAGRGPGGAWGTPAPGNGPGRGDRVLGTGWGRGRPRRFPGRPGCGRGRAGGSRGLCAETEEGGPPCPTPSPQAWAKTLLDGGACGPWGGLGWRGRWDWSSEALDPPLVLNLLAQTCSSEIQTCVILTQTHPHKTFIALFTIAKTRNQPMSITDKSRNQCGLSIRWNIIHT